MLHIQRQNGRASVKRWQIGALMVLAVVTGSMVLGCGGGGAKTSVSQETGGLSGGNPFPPEINGRVTTSDTAVSTNGTPAPVGGATIVVDNASGAKVAQTQTAPNGTYNIPVPEGVYTVVPSPFVVGSVTLTAPPQQVTVKTVNGNGLQDVPITYTRPQ